jgi:hypothetical protein
VGHGRRAGKPVTCIWRLQEKLDRTPVTILAIFNGDARDLDQPLHGSRIRGGILIERAQAAWLPQAERPRVRKTRHTRTWTFDPEGDRFTATPWR